MPVVPISKARSVKGQPPQQLPPEPYILMAAAQMNAEGRLTQQDRDNGKKSD